MSTKREKILQKLNPNLLKMTPKLSGVTGSFINLDSEDSLEDGAKKLKMRFFRNQDLCEKNKRNLVQSETELTISSAKFNEKSEICELISERLTLPFINNDESNLTEKPGRRLQELQMELQEKMSAKWEEEYKKRVKENKTYSESRLKCKKKCSEESDEDIDDDDELMKKKTSEENERGVTKELDKEEKCDDGDDADVELDDDDDDENSKSDVTSVINDEEINDSSCEDNDNDFEKDEDYESCSLVPAYQPGGGMLFGGSELTQTEEGLPQNLLSPSLRLSLNDSSASKMSSENFNEPTPKKAEVCPNEEAELFLVKTKLFLQNPNDSFDLNDAFEFCSGKFPGESSESQLDIENLLERNLTAVNEDKDDSDYDYEFGDTIEGKFDKESSESENFTSVKEASKIRKNIIAFEDSEEEIKEFVNDIKLKELDEAAPKLLSDDESENEGTKIYDKIIKKKKLRRSLRFSDEEDTSNDCENEGSASEGVSSENEDENDDLKKERDKDDQRSVYYDSEENEIINPKEFFEKEAELSGSEWSGDEDEKGLDDFDVEEGDLDNIDDNQVRSQLEKIHIRRLLDDDAREVRLIQEILFEDGDLHSDEKRRDKKFKWKNLGTFNEQANEEGAKQDGGNSSEDDGAEEEALRKLRHEKELFFMTKKKHGDLSSDDEIVENFRGVKVTTIKTAIKISADSESRVTSVKTITGRTEIPKTFSLSNSRGSFLTRNEQFLSKLAKSTSGVTDNVLGPKNSKNFVFATKSPEKTNSERNMVCKRQIADVENCSHREKKIKLLSPEIDTGPSILDLLV